MTGSQIFSKLSEQSLEEHALIHFHLDQLERALSDLDPASAQPETLRTVAVRIDSFKERLDEHFGTEEDGVSSRGSSTPCPKPKATSAAFARSTPAWAKRSKGSARSRAAATPPKRRPSRRSWTDSSPRCASTSGRKTRW